MTPARVVVIGAGVAGLAAATALRREAPDADVLVLERSGRVGGLVESERTPDGFVLEHGADCLLTTKPAGLAAWQAMATRDAIITGGRAPRRTYVSTRHGLTPLPPVLGGIGREALSSLLRTPLLSPAGKARMALEPFVRRRRGTADESVRAFATRRFGAEVADAIIEPLIGGIYGGDSDRLSAEACLSRLRAFERQHGSVTRGLRRAVSAWRRQAPSRLPPTISFRGGMAALPDAFAAALGPAVSLGVDVQRIVRRGGRHFSVETARGAIECDGVVVAVPAWGVPPLVERLSVDLAAAHAALAHKPLVCVTLAWPRREVPRPLDGTGWVRGPGDRHATLACTWASEKWADRAPQGFVLVRSVLEAHDVPDRESVETACRDLRDMIGVATPPALVRVRRRSRATPIYEIGHLARASRMRRDARALGALAVAGNAYEGIGLPDCIASGEHAARAVLDALDR